MGFAFEEFAVGTAIDLGTTTVDEGEMLAFARRFDPQPFHTDPAAATDSMLGGLCASGWFTCALWMRAYFGAVLAGSTSQSSPGGSEIAWPAPVFPGETLRSSVRVLEARRSGSRPMLGLVTIQGRSEVTLPADRAGVQVLRFTFVGMFGLRGPAVEASP
jgi:acyl dehydratase